MAGSSVFLEVNGNRKHVSVKLTLNSRGMLEGVLGVLYLLIITGVFGVGEEYSGRAHTALVFCISKRLSSFFIAAS